ncbi:DNA-directed DNA polymerase eta rad30 [Boothiomyces sp. JEL0838]|nr:DNA-directed DNA polymerase eta rad30 [Boothiomyces sp. JEL0838]
MNLFKQNTKLKIKKTKKKTEAKKEYKQTHLNFGQRKLSEYETCKECQMKYNKYSEEDLKIHSKYHTSIFNWNCPDASTYTIISLKSDSSKWKRFLEILNIVNNELGAAHQQDLDVENHKNQIVGLLLALEITDGYRISNNQVDKENKMPAQIGISRIWVSYPNRRKGIGKLMLDYLRKNFYYGVELPKESIAFSQPTDSGNQLATSYFKRPDYLVYIEN